MIGQRVPVLKDLVQYRWCLSQVTTHEIHWYVMSVFRDPFEVESNAKTTALVIRLTWTCDTRIGRRRESMERCLLSVLQPLQQRSRRTPTSSHMSGKLLSTIDLSSTCLIPSQLLLLVYSSDL